MRTRHAVVPGPNHDPVELVWENGTLPVRGRTNPNNDVRFSNNELVGHEEENEGRGKKTPRIGSHPSVFLFGGGRNRPNIDRNSQQYQIPTSYLPPKFNSNHHLLPTNGFSKPSKGSIDGEMKKMNFSHFRGFDSLKNDAAIGQGIGSTSHNRITPTKVETDNLNKKPLWGGKDMQIGCREQPIHVGTGVVMAVPPSSMAGGGDSLVPDEHSQAIGNNFIEDHFIRNSEFDDDHQVPGPDSSMGASDAPPCKSKRSARFNQPESRYQDEDQEQEEMKGRKRRKLHHAGGSNGTKGSRSATHNLSEKKRRDRINKRMRALQELLPNCDKVDKASVLDEAIEYMKTLQLQLQIMSTGNRMFPSPMAMLPAGIHQLPLPYLNQFPLMSPGMGLRMGPGFVQGPAHQFPLPGPSSTALAGGFQPMVCMPYIPVLGGHPALRSLVNGADFSRAVATMIEQLGSAATSGSNDSQKAGRN